MTTKRFLDIARYLLLAGTIPETNERLTLDLLMGNDYFLVIIQSEKRKSKRAYISVVTIGMNVIGEKIQDHVNMISTC